MIKDLVERVIESIVTPRLSARRFLAGGPHRLDTVAALVLGAYLVQALAQVAIPGSRPAGGVSPVALHLAGLAFQVIVLGISAALVFVVGRLFGGRAGFEDCVAAMAWYGFVTSFLSPLALIGWVGSTAEPASGSALPALLFLGAGALGIWVFAGFVAELHGFRSTGLVIGAIFGLVFAVSLLLLPLLPPP